MFCIRCLPHPEQLSIRVGVSTWIAALTAALSTGYFCGGGGGGFEAGGVWFGLSIIYLFILSVCSLSAHYLLCKVLKRALESSATDFVAARAGVTQCYSSPMRYSCPSGCQGDYCHGNLSFSVLTEGVLLVRKPSTECELWKCAVSWVIPTIFEMFIYDEVSLSQNEQLKE